MRAIPYLNFDGNCGEAFDFYAEVLGGRVEVLQTHGDSPIADEVPVEARDRVLHAYLVAGDLELMGSDSLAGWYDRPRGLYVSLQLDDPAEAERIFRRFAEGGRVSMPLERTFWSDRFGMLVDRYGTPWMVNCAASARAAG